MKEIEDILEEELVDGYCSCRKGKGTDYALKLLKKYLVETSNFGKKDCFFLKIDLSGYFMSIDRKQVSEKFSKLIRDKYKGKHKELLLYLTPVIFENNPALNYVVFWDGVKKQQKLIEKEINNVESSKLIAIFYFFWWKYYRSVKYMLHLY